MPQSLTKVVDILSYLLHSGSWVCLVFCACKCWPPAVPLPGAFLDHFVLRTEDPSHILHFIAHLFRLQMWSLTFLRPFSPFTSSLLSSLSGDTPGFILWSFRFVLPNPRSPFGMFSPAMYSDTRLHPHDPDPRQSQWHSALDTS